jgi:HK97 gp10 family phage protein
LIIGHQKLEERLNKMANMDLRSSVNEAIGLVQQSAKDLCPSHSGELRQSIYTVTEQIEEAWRGTCYTNKKYGQYVEFGTGPNGQASHDGISPEVAVAYSQKGWMIPADAMSLGEAESYGLGISTGANGQVIGYYTNGQAAHPFMYPALKNNEKEVTKIILNSVRSQL